MILNETLKIFTASRPLLPLSQANTSQLEEAIIFLPRDGELCASPLRLSPSCLLT